jgi:ABC-type phosphonate transport system ATPase subunit
MWIVYLLGILLAISLYLGYVAVTVPLLAGLACLVYAFGMPIVYLKGMGKVLVTRSKGLPAAAKWPKPITGSDPALFQYFYGPAMADARHAVKVASGNCQDLWESGTETAGDAFTGEDTTWFTAPLAIGGVIGMAIGSLIGLVITGVLAFIHLLVVAISAALVRITGFVLRGADSAMLRVKNVKMICPYCYERVPYPAYDCPSPDCASRHRDVRPGKYGIIRRRCRCGARMNTLLLFGSSRMAAFCPHPGCEHSLEHRPGEAPEIVLPFFGAIGAGKTRLLFSMVTQLQTWTEKGQLKAEFGDSSTARELDIASTVMRSGSSTIATSVELPRAHVIRLTVKRGTRILQLFDAAGERFYNTDRTQELRYLNKARTFILVIDPLSVEGFWQQLPASSQAELSSVRSTAPSPELAYQQTHQQMEAMGVELKKVRLAVVFSRADLIGVVGEQDSDVTEWARGILGLGNLIRSTGQNFKEVGYFRTAAIMDAEGTMHKSIAELMDWVMAKEGVELPGAAS